MLEPQARQSLLSGKGESKPTVRPGTQAPSVNNQVIKSGDRPQAGQSGPKQKKKKQKKSNTQFTSVLKVFNMIIGLCVIGFGVSCYKFFDADTKLSDQDYVGIILPGYISFSGLIIVLIECNLGFMIRNMRFLYNFLGRGLFNIYVGVMPLSLIRSKDQDQNFQIIIYVLVSLMGLVGVLYIFAKLFCCAKEDDKTKKRRDSSDSDSD